MKKTKKAVVVGTGWPALQHIKGYQNNSDTEVAAICDVNEDRCNQVAVEFGIPCKYTDFRQMLEKEKPDMVSICTPNYLHAKMSIDAMRQGANVICEKPMASSVEEAQAMIDTQKKTGKVLMIAHQRRFSSQAQYLKKIISEGKLGEIYHARAYWVRRQGIPGMGGWFTQKEMSGGGALIDIGVHVLDLALWFLGHPEPMRVESAWGSRFGVHGKGASGYASVKKPSKSGFDVDDYVFAHVNYPSGVSLQLQCSWAGFIKSEESNIELWGSKGGARLYPLEIFTEIDNVQVDITPKIDENNPYEEEMRLFIEAVINHLPSPYDPREGLKVVELVNAIYANGNCDPGKDTSSESLDNKQFEMV